MSRFMQLCLLLYYCRHYSDKGHASETVESDTPRHVH